MLEMKRINYGCIFKRKQGSIFIGRWVKSATSVEGPSGRRLSPVSVA